MVPITDTELRSPYYKYFVRRMVEPRSERYEGLREYISPEDALAPENVNKLFEDGYLPVEEGCCRFPNGTVMLAALTKMPDVSPEMLDWWYAWHGLDPMRFKIWNHHEHYYCKTRNPEVALNASLSMKERYWNTIHDVEENTGFGIENSRVHYRNPLDVGFDSEKLKCFNGTIVCAGDERSPMFICHFLRLTEEGWELRSRIWLGYGIVNGRPKKLLPDGAFIPLEPARALLEHILRDMSHLAAVLPELYEQFRESF